MKQEAGSNSHNIQVAGNVTIGISASDARQIALDVFHANFYKLSEKAGKIAYTRAEEITIEFIDKLYDRIPHLEERLEEPAVQGTIFRAQSTYAKSGDTELKDYLLELLIKRIEADERSLNQIVFDEAISAIPKITRDQISVLSLLFSILVCKHHAPLNIPQLGTFLKSKILPFFPANKFSNYFFSHLQYTGSCTILPQASSYYPYEKILSEMYFGLFSKGFSIEQLEDSFGEDNLAIRNLLIQCHHDKSLFQFKALNESTLRINIKNKSFNNIEDRIFAFEKRFRMSSTEIEEFLISLDERMKLLLDTWKRKDFNTIQLTSVGLVIAIINYNRVTGDQILFEKYF
jgi:hypothetical protein